MISAGRLIATLDVGTTVVKGALWEAGGRRVGSVSTRLPSPKGTGGRAEQALADIDAVVDGVLRGLAGMARATEWRGLSVAMQRGTLVLCDEDGRPLTELVSWLDRRGGRWEWFQREAPEIARRARRFRSIASLWMERLTGEPLDTAQTAPPEAETLLAAGLAGPRRVSPGHIAHAGTASRHLPEGLPLVVAGGDKNAEMLGASGLGARATLSFGTAVSLGLLHRGEIPSGPIFATPSAIEGCVHLEVGVPFGGATVQWLGSLVGRPELPAEPPPALTFLPYLAGSLRHPEATGAWLGLTPSTTAAELAAAVLAGIVLELRRGAEVLGSFGRVGEVLLCGGGAASPRLPGWLAAALGVRVGTFDDAERGLAGAASIAAFALGIEPTWESALGRFAARPTRWTEPDAARGHEWDRRYEAFRRAGAALFPPAG